MSYSYKRYGIETNEKNDWHCSLEAEVKFIEAEQNWWGYNKSTAVVGKMRDYRDSPELLRIRYDPYVRDNRTVLSGKCDPGWTLVGDTCYLYMGVPMNFSQAKNFCKKDNASLPYLMSNYYGVMEFLQSQQKGFDHYSRAWVQHLDMIGRCVVFINRRVEQSPCDLLLPFLCEAGIHKSIHSMINTKNHEKSAPIAVFSALKCSNCSFFCFEMLQLQFFLL